MKVKISIQVEDLEDSNNYYGNSELILELVEYPNVGDQICFCMEDDDYDFEKLPNSIKPNCKELWEILRTDGLDITKKQFEANPSKNIAVYYYAKIWH